MKRTAIDHPKVRSLAKRLVLPHFAVVGVLECLWHFTAKHAICGDVGKWSDEEIATAIGWDRDPTELITALVDSRLVDRHTSHRLVVHDWHAHCDESTTKTVRNRKYVFASVPLPIDTVSEPFEKILESSGNLPSKPEPEPEPEPEPITTAASGEPTATSQSQQLLDAWNSTRGVKRANKLTASRSKAMRARLSDPAWRDSWRTALAKFPLLCFPSAGDWTPNLDWFLKPDTVNNILEGKYDWSKNQSAKPNHTNDLARVREREFDEADIESRTFRSASVAAHSASGAYTAKPIPITNAS